MREKEEIQEEVDFLKYCSKLYETEGISPITDEEWDRRYEKLKKEAPDHPFFNEVGGLPKIISSSSSRKKVKHLRKMGSFEKSKNISEFDRWFKKTYIKIAKKFDNPSFGFIMQPKIDGLAITLIYAFGKLQMAITRGDGEVGIDVTRNARMIDGVLPEIPHKSVMLEIRGEVYKDKNDFYENFSGKYSNPRNFAAGTINLNSPKDVKKRGLSFIAYDIYGLPFTTEIIKLNFLNQLGFNTLAKETKAACGWSKITNEIKKYMDSLSGRNDIPYPIDGIVIKINDLVTKAKLGFSRNGKVPNANRAIKFKTAQAETTLLSIEWNVSRNQRLVPVGILKEVELLDTKISRVTLNNFYFVKKHKIFPNSKIIIEKSGDIIPHFVRIIKESKQDYTFPINCPECGSKLIKNKTDLLCVNNNCPAKIIKRITFWFETIGINGIGEAFVRKIVKAFSIKTISQFYQELLDINNENKLRKILGNKNFENIAGSVFMPYNRKIPIDKFIIAIGIPGIGNMIERIINQFKIQSLEDIDSLTAGKINSIHGFGIKKTKDFIEGWIEKREEIEELLTYIDIQFPYFMGKLQNINFVITGKFENPTRKELENLLQKEGGKIKNSVSKNTNFLIWDKKINSTKLKKAKELKIPIISKEEIMIFLKKGDK